jgi:hypothetical protein
MHDTNRGGLDRNSDNGGAKVATERTPAISGLIGLDATPLRSRAIPNRVSNHFTDDAASRASTGINGELNEETLDLSDEVLSTSMF